MYSLKKTLRLLMVLGAALLVCAWSQPQVRSQNLSDEAKSRRWRVMVIVPEQHLERRNIPDPAAETMICKQLIDAGYKVIDQERIKELRYAKVMDRILKGGPGAVKESIQLGRRLGADILIAGEAFSQEVTRRNIETDEGTVTSIQCRARVELKGIRMDTGEKFYADSIQKTGAPDLTVELSSKLCLEQAAEAVSPSILKKLDKLALGSGQYIELEIRGLPSISLANQLETALSKLPGVRDVGAGSYDARTYEVEMYLAKGSVRNFASKLETSPALKRFRLRVQSANGSKIVANCR